MNGLKKIFETLFVKRERHLEKSNLEQLISELEEVYLKKQRIERYLEKLNIKEEVHKQYENLDAESVARINILAQKAKDIEEKKQNLRGRLISTNAALNRLTKYEEEIPGLIKEMQIAEKRRRETESQMLYLKEEKILLAEERESLIGGYRFLKGFSLTLVVIMGVCLLISFVMLQILREKIWFVLSGIVFFVIIGVFAIVLVKEKLEKEIRNNGILQQKAVKYLNKAKIRFFNQTQYLEFQYRKLGVDSVAKLELYYNRYLKSKNNERVYLQMNDTLTEIEEEITEILKTKNISPEHIKELSDWLFQPKLVHAVKQVEEERTKTKEQFKALTLYEDDIWRELKLISENEEMREKILDALKDFEGENRLDKIEASE